MKASDIKIFISGIALGLTQLCIYFICLLTGSTLWGKFGAWKTCGGYDECQVKEQSFLNTIFFYEIRMLLMAIATFIFIYFVYKRHAEEIIKSSVVTIVLSIIWLPAVWYQLGYLREHTLDTVLFIIIGGFIATWLVRKNT